MKKSVEISEKQSITWEVFHFVFEIEDKQVTCDIRCKDREFSLLVFNEKLHSTGFASPYSYDLDIGLYGWPLFSAVESVFGGDNETKNKICDEIREFILTELEKAGVIGGDKDDKTSI